MRSLIEVRALWLPLSTEGRFQCAWTHNQPLAYGHCDDGRVRTRTHTYTRERTVLHVVGSIISLCVEQGLWLMRELSVVVVHTNRMLD